MRKPSKIRVCECGHAAGTHHEYNGAHWSLDWQTNPDWVCPHPWRHKHGCTGAGCGCKWYRFDYETDRIWIDRQHGLT